jgi:universal stress protein A
MPLPKTIIVATDFSAIAQRAQADGVALAKSLEARLVLLHIWQPPLFAREGLYIDEVYSQLEANHQAMMRHALAHARAVLPAAEGRVITGVVRAGIVAAACELGADLIVLGTHDRHRLHHVLLGSVAEWVVHHAPCATWLVREPMSAHDVPGR